MYNELLKVTQQRKYFEEQLDVKKKAFTDSIALEAAALKDLQEAEDKLRENVLIKMKQDNENIHQEGDSTISLVQKITRKIESPEQLLSAFTYNADSINKLLPKATITELTAEYFERQLIVKEKAKLLEIVNKFEAVEGKLLAGVVDQCTEYLTIKNN